MAADLMDKVLSSLTWERAERKRMERLAEGLALATALAAATSLVLLARLHDANRALSVCRGSR